MNALLFQQEWGNPKRFSLIAEFYARLVIHEAAGAVERSLLTVALWH